MVSDNFFALFMAAFLASTISSSYALNDWTKPCFEAECSFDIPDASGAASGSLKIWADTTDAIADITTAADWEVMGCDPDKIAQDIRIVCKTEDSEKCARLFSSGTAEGKIARLPSACGPNAFARIGKKYTPEDQSIPSDIARRLVRRDGVPPIVEGLSLDTEFSLIDSAKFGKVRFAVQGANVPGAKGDIPIGTPKILNRRLFGGLGDALGDIGKGIADGVTDVVNAGKDVVEDVVDGGKDAVENVVNGGKDVVEDVVNGGKDVVENVAEEIVDTGKDVVEGVKDVAEDAVNAVVQGAKVVFEGAGNGLEAIGDGVKKATKFVDQVLDDLNNIEVDKSVDLPPIEVTDKFNLFNEKLTCDFGSGVAKGDLNVKAQALITLGVAAAGTIVPPQIEDFAVSATLNADLDSSIDLDAGLSGKLDSGKIKLFEAGIPGLSFPGILTVGPSFKVDGQAIATLDLRLKMQVGVNYKITDAKLVFPPRDGPNGGSFDIGETPLSLSASPSATATGKVEAHLIPSLNVGLDAIGGVVKANVFVALDASAGASLELNAQAQGDVVIGGRRSLASRQPLLLDGRQEDEVAVEEEAQPADSESQVQTAGSVDFGGCFKVFANLNVNAGAEADFFSLFDESTKVELFNQDFDLFERCFGNQEQRRSLGYSRGLPASWASLDKTRRVHRLSRSLRHLSLEKRAFECPAQAVAEPKTIVESANTLA